MTARASRLVKVACVALGLVGGLAGGLYGYRSYALRARSAATTEGSELAGAGAQEGPGTAAGGHPASANAGAAAAASPTSPDPAPEVHAAASPSPEPRAPSDHGPQVAAAAGEPATALATTPAEREARLMERLAATAPALGAAAPSGGGVERPAPSPSPGPRPGSPAAREAELIRRLAEGALPAATHPLVVRPPIASIAPEARARADLAASGKAAAEERRLRESAWPAIQETEPPPGPVAPSDAPVKPKPRPPRLELPSRLDTWGE